MSDSDEDDNFELYGTPLDPLDEDSIPKKKPFSIEDQVATDEQGRRRFHGAFTGGFSAGFFNTVGSLEGWKPSEFRSSRSEKADKRSQKPEDFMDQEDLGEFGIAHKKLKATSDYSQSNKRKRTYQTFEGPIPGEPILYSVLEPARETVGVKLLKKMGWKPGQGVGPRMSKKEKRKIRRDREKIEKTYGCEVPKNFQKFKNSDTESDHSEDELNELNFAPEDYDPYFQKPKNDIFGLGYIGLVPSTQKVLNSSQFCLTDRNKKKLSITGQAFGVGAFETEDDDIYSRDDLANYDFELGGPQKAKKVPQAQIQDIYHSTILEGFVTQSKKLALKKNYPPPEIPKSFLPKHGARISRFDPLPESHKLFNFEKKKGRHDLTHSERSTILNSENFGGPSQNLGHTLRSSGANLDQKIQNLLDFCKNQISNISPGSENPILSLKDPSLNISDPNLGSKEPKAPLGSKNLLGLNDPLGLGSKHYLQNRETSNDSGENQNSTKTTSGQIDPLGVGGPLGSKSVNLGSEGHLQLRDTLHDSSQNKNPTKIIPGQIDPLDFGGSLGSKNINLRSEGHLQNLSLRGQNLGWQTKLFGPAFAKGEVLNDTDQNRSSTKTTLGQIDPKGSENQILLEKARKITEGLSKVECVGFKPFIADKDKQNRYETFLTLSKHGLKDRLAEIQPLSMSNFEKEREILEFEQASKLFKPTFGLVFDKFVTSSDSTADLDPMKSASRSVFDHGTLEMREAAKKKMFGPLTRVVFEWTPHKLLCRRFNVPEPKASEEMVPVKKRNRFNIFDYYEAYQQNRNKAEEENTQKKENIEDQRSTSTSDTKIKEIKETIIEKHKKEQEPSTSTNTKNIPIIEENEEKEENDAIEEQETHDSEEILQVPTDPKAKKDLFKAIFLSSSESEESDIEDTEEKLEEMKKIVEESLIQQSIEDTNTTKKKEEMIPTSAKKGFFSDLDLTKFQKPAENTDPTIMGDKGSSQKEDPSIYGPMLPLKVTPSLKVGEEWRPVFTKPRSTTKNVDKINKVEVLKKESSVGKSEVKKLDKVLKIIVNESPSSSEEWVEADKSSKKKSSKKNKKHKKHKEKHKKHKSKHKKRKNSESD